MNGESYLSEEVFARLRSWGGNKLVVRLIDLFLKNAPERLEAARKGQEIGDLKAIEEATHAFKTSAGNLGIAKLQNLAATIEELAEKEKGEPIPALLNELESVYAQVKPMLEKERKEITFRDQ